ncbi:MAG TPA: phosphonatase-like hydrolase [Minicystis sp.]|nr:phosphonatase-like hydrolase [Minicystis sp.]
MEAAAMRLVVFDMAGTTVKDDDAVHRALAATVADAGVRVTRDEVNAVMGLPKPDAIRRLLVEHGPGGAVDRIVPRLHAAFVARMRDHYAAHAEEVPGASETFAALHQGGVLVALDTGFDRAIAAPILERIGWRARGLVDAVVTSDEVSHGRPAPDMIFEAMRRLDVASADDVAKVGDTPADLVEGTSAGCRFVIGVTSGSHTRAELVSHPHTHLVARLADVVPIVLPGRVLRVA